MQVGGIVRIPCLNQSPADLDTQLEHKKRFVVSEHRLTAEMCSMKFWINRKIRLRDWHASTGSCAPQEPYAFKTETQDPMTVDTIRCALFTVSSESFVD